MAAFVENELGQMVGVIVPGFDIDDELSRKYLQDEAALLRMGIRGFAVIYAEGTATPTESYFKGRPLKVGPWTLLAVDLGLLESVITYQELLASKACIKTLSQIEPKVNNTSTKALICPFDSISGLLGFTSS